jgi:hypothetical protein
MLDLVAADDSHRVAESPQRIPHDAGVRHNAIADAAVW